MGTALAAIGVAGSFLSLLGVLVALWQIRKTRTAAEAAAQAAQGARDALTRNVVLSDLTACTTAIDEVKVLVRHERHESALLRVTDLSRSIVQLQESRRAGSLPKAEVKRMLTQLSILRDLLERGVHGDETVSPVQVNSTLSQVADSLNAFIGRLKFRAPGD